MNRRLITAWALGLALLAASSKTAVAQDRDHDANGEHRGGQRDDWNHDHHDSFSDQDREATREWYRQHQTRLGAGWRERDRLPPAMEARLRRGERLDLALRRRIYWVPADLARRYGPAPRGYRYAIIGGNIVMLDTEYRVHDVFRIDFQIR